MSANEFVMEPAKRVPVVQDVDVAVAGAGCAGVFAAIAAAKYGAKTLLIERLGTLGGNVGAGGIYGCTDPFREGPMQMPQGNVGIVREFVARVEALRAGLPDTRPVHSVMFARVAAEMMDQYGVKLMLSAFAADPIVEAGRVQGLFVETKSGRIAVRAKTVIDDTAEADLAMRAGAPMIRHVPGDPDFSPVILARYRQPQYKNWNEVGLAFLAGGVDWAAYEAFCAGAEAALIGDAVPSIEPNGIINSLDPTITPSLKYPARLIPKLKEAWENGSYRLAKQVLPQAGLFWQANMNDPAKGWIRIGQGGAEGTVIIYGDIDTDDWRHVSLAEHELRKHAFDTVAFMRAHAPGWQGAHLLFTQSFIGARGGACIVGDYCITPNDIVTGARFDDVVLRSIWEAKRCVANKKATPQTKDGYDLPYRMMLPKGLDGMLVVGRGSSYIRRGHDPATRGRVTQFHLGQAAGTAAAFAAKAGTTVRTLDVRALQRELIREGFFFGDTARLNALGLP